LELGVGGSGPRAQSANAASIANILLQSALSLSPSTAVDHDRSPHSRSHSPAPSSVVSWPASSSNDPHALCNKDSPQQQQQQTQRAHSLNDAIVIVPSDLTHTTTYHSANALQQHTTFWTRWPTDPTKLPIYLWPLAFLPFAAMLIIIMLIVLIGVVIRSYF
jgi:hypothetical protein